MGLGDTHRCVRWSNLRPRTPHGMLGSGHDAPQNVVSQDTATTPDVTTRNEGRNDENGRDSARDSARDSPVPRQISRSQSALARRGMLGSKGATELEAWLRTATVSGVTDVEVNLQLGEFSLRTQVGPET